jgi:hypothetical protein
MISTKSNSVIFTELTPALAYILYSLEKFHRRNVVPQPDLLVITSINDGVHSTNSRHYKNEAIDLRSKNFLTREMKRKFRSEFELYLGPKFRVLLENLGTENEHFHIQVRKGQEFLGA